MNIDLTKIKKIHFIGIGGMGMSALARYFVSQRKVISGSDAVATPLTKELQQEGIQVFIGQKKDNISKDTDLVIITSAIPKDNLELKEAKKQNIPIVFYAQALGLLTKEKYTIAVAGTHGKSTITSMIALLLEQGGLDPTVIVGTKIKEFGNKNFRLGQSNFLVIEACEYKEAFLNYYPSLIVIPNIECDHLDYFKNEQNYVLAFKKFVKKLPHTGYFINNGDDVNIQSITSSIKGRNINLSFAENSFKFENNEYQYPQLSLPGKHNKINASLAFMVGKVLDIPEKIIKQTLSKFSGTWRRFEKKGFLPTGALCFDDYGHHPTEVKATLQGAKEMFPKKRIICVFQPHQYSRTTHFLSDFGQSFSDADLVIIPDIYEARDFDEKESSIKVKDVIQKIRKYHKNVIDSEGLENTAKILLKDTTKDDVVVTMGAGDITTIYSLLKI